MPLLNLEYHTVLPTVVTDAGALPTPSWKRAGPPVLAQSGFQESLF